ncbi:MAG: radical SAM protein, partial [Candidatus Geothermincolia bacterium]
MNEPTYRVTTLGCRVNKADSLAIERELASRGFRRAGPDAVPDVWVLNTCAVTSEGMRKSRKAVRRSASSGARVIVTGCGVDFDAKAFEVEGVDSLFTNVDKENIVERTLGPAGAMRLEPQFNKEELVRVPVKVQEGCRRFCAYCVVPFLRPEPSSKPTAEIVREVEELERRGVGEAILCGIDLGSYLDPDTGGRLDSVVEAVSETAPGIWLRLSSIELSDVGEGILEHMRARRLSSHLHLPLQSG